MIKPILISLITFNLTSLIHAQSVSTEKSQEIEKTQSHVETSRVLPFPAEKVWKLIAGFNTLSDFHAAVTKSRLEEGGAVRHLTISKEAGGGTVVERLVHFDDEKMTFSYKIIELIESPLPLHNYQAWAKLEAIDQNSCRLSWSSKFNAMGASKDEAENVIRLIYKGCYDGIERVLGK
jgi:hypothetical protein